MNTNRVCLFVFFRCFVVVVKNLSNGLPPPVCPRAVKPPQVKISFDGGAPYGVGDYTGTVKDGVPDGQVRSAGRRPKASPPPPPIVFSFFSVS